MHLLDCNLQRNQIHDDPLDVQIRSKVGCLMRVPDIPTPPTAMSQVRTVHQNRPKSGCPQRPGENAPGVLEELDHHWEQMFEVHQKLHSSKKREPNSIASSLRGAEGHRKGHRNTDGHRSSPSDPQSTANPFDGRVVVDAHAAHPRRIGPLGSKGSTGRYAVDVSCWDAQKIEGEREKPIDTC